MRLRLSEERSLSLATLGLLGLILAVTAYDQPRAVGPVSLDTVVIMVPLAILLCIPYIRRVGIADVPRYLMGPIVLVFLGWGLVSVMVTGGHLSGWLAMARYASYFLLAIAISVVSRTPAVRRLLLWTMAVTSGLTAVLAYAQFRDPKLTPGMNGISAEITTRVVGTFYNSNFYAEYLLLMIGVTIALLFTEKRFARVIVAGIGIVQLVALLLTYTRGSWMGLVVGVLIFVIVADMRYLVVVAMVGAATLFVPGVVARLQQSDANAGSADFRLGIWEIVGHAIRNHPVFGFGAGDFLGAYREVVVAHPELYQGYMGFGAHNSYFELAAEIGIVGGVSFFLVTVQYATRGLFVATRKGVDFATKYTALGLSVGLTGFIANTFTSNTFQHPQSGLFFWILAGIVAGLGAGLWDAEIRPGTTGEIAADGAVAGSAAAGVLTRTRAWFSRVWRASSAFQVSGASPKTGRESWLQSSVVLRWMFGEGERTHRDGE